MRATLVLAGLTLAALLVVGCDSDGHSHADRDHRSDWNQNDRYDDQDRDARPAGGEIAPYNNRSSDHDWHRYRDDENN